jgi:hypothetical protein
MCTQIMPNSNDMRKLVLGAWASTKVHSNTIPVRQSFKGNEGANWSMLWAMDMAATEMKKM